MHELSIVTSLLEIIRDEMAKNGVTRLLEVRLRYGSLANVVPDALMFGFEALTEGTPLAGARLVCEEIPLRLTCACGVTFTPERGLFGACCPACKAMQDHVAASGRELYIESIEAE